MTADKHKHSGAAKTPALIRDPVCGMTVDPGAGKPTHEHGGRLYHFCCAGCRDKFAAAPGDYMTAIDPVCGMTVDRASARQMTKHDGERYYFCSSGCRDKFEADPAKYVSDRPAPVPEAAGTIYTCPMHPEVRQEGPGKCPKCGMFLVPEGGADEHAGGCCGGKGHGAGGGCCCGKGHGHHDHADHGSGDGAPGGKYDTVPTGWTGAVYTCPMHPEVRQTRPGDCPLCGMGLELDAVAGGEDGPNPELVDFTRRF